MAVRTPALCEPDFSAEKGDTVEWQNPVVNCIVSQDGTNPFPFISDPPNDDNSINISPAPPKPAPKIIVDVDPSTTPYNYQITCCEIATNPVHTVTVTDTRAAKRR